MWNRRAVLFALLSAEHAGVALLPRQQIKRASTMKHAPA
jgi:hypothetical protein